MVGVCAPPSVSLPVSQVIARKRLLSLFARMRFSVKCFLCTLTAAGAIRCNVAAASEAVLTGRRRRLHAVGERGIAEESVLHEPSAVPGLHTLHFRDTARVANKSVRGGGPHGAPGERQPADAAAEHTSRNTSSAEGKQKKGVKSGLIHSHSEGRSLGQNSAKEKELTGSGNVDQTSTHQEKPGPNEEGTADSEHTTKKEGTPERTTTNDSYRGAAAAGAGQETRGLKDVPMTREQRLALLLDYSVTLPLQHDDREERGKSTRRHRNKPRSSPKSRRTQRQEKSNGKRRRSGVREHLSALLVRGARDMKRLPSQLRGRSCTNSRSSTLKKIGGGVLATVGLLAWATWRRGRRMSHTGSTEHSPHFEAAKAWASQRRAQLGLRAVVLPLESIRGQQNRGDTG